MFSERINQLYEIKLGFVPTRRNVFSKEAAGEQKLIVENWLKINHPNYVNLDWLNDEEILYNPADADKIAFKFNNEGVDALFIPHCNFGTEEAVARLAVILKKPVLIWAPRDEGPDDKGYRLRDAQCGVFATSKVLQRFGVTYTYITNSTIDEHVFKRGFDNFISTARVIKAFKKLRIGQIGPRPKPFWSVICNEGELIERFGIQTVPISLVDIGSSVKSIIKKNGIDLKETIDGIKSRISNVYMDEEALVKIAALKIAMQKFSTEEELSAICIQCWDALQDLLSIAPCFVNSELTEDGIPVSCETDIHGAVTSVILQAAAKDKPTFFADLTIRHPKNDNSELLWHCGNFPHAICIKDGKDYVGDQFGMKKPGAADWGIQGGQVTITRFDGLKGEYSLLMGQATGVEGPYTRGTYLWIEVEDWPLWEHKFIYGPYIHHCSGVHGFYLPPLLDACRYIPGLKADLVGVDENEIYKTLRS